ncbi:hypothetical protein PGT21_022055 [Puccinia graminis f. sp. tritici]|uniref:Uncharacterized protein n=1 Tax=Puccinia graminis f. sp. tritici TaxID=56615 RepID=A0A5B0MF70_PUCGR|nr:hypothetical protein PGT21_022055 [Puccinia graminis f. sp. tritici]
MCLAGHLEGGYPRIPAKAGGYPPGDADAGADAAFPGKSSRISASTRISRCNTTISTQKDAKTNETSAAPHAPQPQAESPATTTCYHKSKSHGICNALAYRALDKVVFAPNQTLDKFSSLIFANYKTWNVHIRKPQNVTL